MPRPVPEPQRSTARSRCCDSARRPLIVAGGGVAYSEANDALRSFAEATGIPVGESQAGKGRCRTTTRWHSVRSAAPVQRRRTGWRAEADVVLGIGTRYSDFTTASRTAFQDPDVRFVNVNVAALDAVKHAGIGARS